MWINDLTGGLEFNSTKRSDDDINRDYNPVSSM
jgi:hypothetical protein